jgi:cytochrome c-type biogenesis protein CcmH
MILWLSLAFLTLLVLVVVLRPLLVREARVEGGEDAEVYASQLAEVEADRERGLISPADAEAARAEIARRLLRARRAVPASVARGRAVAAALTVALLLPAVAIGLYASLGAPTYGDQPLAARLAPITDDELAEMLATAEARLADRPDDGEGWAAVAPVYQRMGRYDDAADAYRRAAEILGETPERLLGRAEALTFANRGTVTEEARDLFARVAELAPEAEAPQIFLAIASRQAGDFTAAAERWRALIDRSDGDEPWLEIASAEFMRMGGTDPFIADDGSAAPAPPAPRIGAAPGPTTDQVNAAAGMTDEAREAMIAGMVEGLAGRLDTNGGSADDWLRLIRSYQVLGRTDDARAAAERALAALSGTERDRVAGEADVQELLQ